MDYYLPIIIKFVLGLLVFILQINLTGKGNLAPSTALDAVQNYVLGGIIGGVIYNENITILQFVMVLIIWTIIVLTLRFFKDHNRFIRNIIDGQPVTLIKNGKIRVEECLKHGISANDLMFKLRNKGIYEVAKVKSGILEQNGQLTVIEFSDKDHVRYPLISDGQLNVDVLELINQDEEWLIYPQEGAPLKCLFLEPALPDAQDGGERALYHQERGRHREGGMPCHLENEDCCDDQKGA